MELIPLLADRLWDLNLEVCQQAALALGRLRQDGAIPMLVRSLRSPNTPIELQLEIIRALGWIGSQSALDALQQLLTEFPPLPQLVSQELITTLGNWTAPELRLQASQILIQTLTNQPVLMEDRQLRQIVAMGLGQLKQSVALEPLIQLLADGDARVRLHAIAALKRLAPLAARQHLETLHANQELPQDLQRGVAIALREWPTELSR
jgi:HEAT repeat protein